MGEIGEGAEEGKEVGISERDRDSSGVGVHSGAQVRGGEGLVRRCDDGTEQCSVKERLDRF